MSFDGQIIGNIQNQGRFARFKERKKRALMKKDQEARPLKLTAKLKEKR